MNKSNDSAFHSHHLICFYEQQEQETGKEEANASPFPLVL